MNRLKLVDGLLSGGANNREHPHKERYSTTSCGRKSAAVKKGCQEEKRHPRRNDALGVRLRGGYENPPTGW